MTETIVDQRVVQGSPGTIRWTYTNSDGEPVDPSGTVTVGIVDEDGDEIVATSTATTNPEPGVYEYDVTAANTAALGQWTATFTNGTISADVIVEVCGGRLINRAELDRFEPSVRASGATLRELILAAEVEVERICGRAFVPRWRRVTLDGTGRVDLPLPDSDIRSVSSITIAGTALDLVTAEVTVEGRTVRRGDNSAFTADFANIVATYTHGWDRPPHDLKRAIARRVRHFAHQSNTGVGDRAVSYTNEHGNYRLDDPAALATGIPWVDAIYDRYSTRRNLHAGDGSAGGSSGPDPVSMPLHIDVQQGSLYH